MQTGFYIGVSRGVMEEHFSSEMVLKVNIQNNGLNCVFVCPSFLQSHQMLTLAIPPTVDAGLGCWSGLKCFFLPAKKMLRENYW